MHGAIEYRNGNDLPLHGILVVALARPAPLAQLGQTGALTNLPSAQQRNSRIASKFDQNGGLSKYSDNVAVDSDSVA